MKGDPGGIRSLERSVLAAGSLLTADELARLSFPDKQVELIRGVLVVREPPGTWHGCVAGTFFRRVDDFVATRGLGKVFPQDTGFKIARDPDTVRAPDLAFVSGERAGAIPREGYAELVPDLVAEIVSPGDRPGEILAKVSDWLEAGTRLVWVLYPDPHELRVYRADGSVSILGADDVLDGENVLPDFALRVRELLE